MVVLTANNRIPIPTLLGWPHESGHLQPQRWKFVLFNKTFISGSVFGYHSQGYIGTWKRTERRTNLSIARRIAWLPQGASCSPMSLAYTRQHQHTINGEYVTHANIHVLLLCAWSLARKQVPRNISFVTACDREDPRTAPSHYLNQCWLHISKVQRYQSGLISWYVPTING